VAQSECATLLGDYATRGHTMLEQDRARALMKKALNRTIEIDGLAFIADVLNEICTEEVEKVAVMYQQATYAKKWAVCAEACDLLKKVAKELP
jgi:hypothetical protein